jgi:NTE family protein
MGNDSEDDTALGRLFARERMDGVARWFSLPGGATLYNPGEPSDELYFLSAGRLGVFRTDESGERSFFGVIRPGEPAGEMAMVAGTPHSGNVVALRDSELLALTREDFFAAADADPQVMNELAKLMILRTRQAATQSSVGEPKVFGFVAADRGGSIRPLVMKIARAIAELGSSVEVVGSEVAKSPTEWFSNLEAEYDHVLYVAEAGETLWKSIVGRQVDRLFRIGRGGRPPPPELESHAADALQQHRLVDLILVQPSDCPRPTGSEAWLDATGAARLFHMRKDNLADVQRIARVLTGRSIGLVLSGGGARAYAHIGAVKALRTAGVPIDFVGGASMGAIIAASVAMGWDDAEIDRRIRQAFVESSPLDDIAFPILAMTHGVKVKERLTHHFGEVEIADLWLPFFCVSSNLTSGTVQIHRRGKLSRALRASIALPGVMPPMTEDGSVLVDGAVLKNYPADIMRALQLGPVVGVDVSRGRSITAEEMHRPRAWWTWILSGEWRKGPPIVALLMRAATVSTARDLAAARQATDLLIMPNVDGIDIRDWKAFDPGVARGEEATRLALAKLTRPVTELRKG